MCPSLKREETVLDGKARQSIEGINGSEATLPFSVPVNLNFLWGPLRQTTYYYQCSGQAYGDPHSRCNPSHVSHARSRFPLNFKPLHLNHHLSWSKVYSSGSLSNLEPGIPSSSARTVEDWSEMKMLAIYVFFPATRTELDFVWRSQKCHDVITAKRYSSCAHPQPRPPHPG